MYVQNVRYSVSKQNKITGVLALKRRITLGLSYKSPLISNDFI